MTDTDRLEKLDRWMLANGWGQGERRVRFMDEHFEMHVRDWIDSLPDDDESTAQTVPAVHD